MTRLQAHFEEYACNLPVTAPIPLEKRRGRAGGSCGFKLRIFHAHFRDWPRDRARAGNDITLWATNREYFGCSTAVPAIQHSNPLQSSDKPVPEARQRLSSKPLKRTVEASIT